MNCDAMDQAPPPSPPVAPPPPPAPPYGAIPAAPLTPPTPPTAESRLKRWHAPLGTPTALPWRINGVLVPVMKFFPVPLQQEASRLGMVSLYALAIVAKPADAHDVLMYA